MKPVYTKRDLRIFSLILALILALFSIKFCKAGNVLTGGILLAASIAALVSGLIHPFLIIPIHKVLSSVGKVIGFAITTLLFTLIFYCVFTPIGVILRIMKKDILGIRIDKKRDSYWIERKERSISPESLERQF